MPNKPPVSILVGWLSTREPTAALRGQTRSGTRCPLPPSSSCSPSTSSSTVSGHRCAKFCDASNPMCTVRIGCVMCVNVCTPSASLPRWHVFDGNAQTEVGAAASSQCMPLHELEVADVVDSICVLGLTGFTAWYMEKVLPSQWGPRLPWWFILSRTWWCVSHAAQAAAVLLVRCNATSVDTHEQGLSV